MALVDIVNEEQEVLESVWIERAHDILGEDPESRDELIEELKELVESEENLVVPNEDKFYLMFLRGGMMSPKNSFAIMENYFRLRKDYPKYFRSSTELALMEQNVFSQKIHCVLPFRDQHGRRTYVVRPGLWDPDKVPFEDVFCAEYMLSELIIKEERTQIAGVVCIVDASGFGFRQLRAMGIEDSINSSNFLNTASCLASS